MEATARRKLIVFGVAKHAEMVAEIARHLPEFELAGFTANRRFITGERIGDYPLHPFEEIRERCSPDDHAIHVALEHSRQSADRARIAGEAEALGYQLASIVHPSAIIAPSAEIGRHAFIGEGVMVQSFARIGANVAINAGSLIGMSVDIASDVYLGTRVTIERYARIAANCTIGSGSTIAEGCAVASQCTLQPRCVVTGAVPVGTLTHPLLTRPGRIIDRSRARLTTTP
jgi:UDP-perosamine 4-acetyltransferase